MWERLQKLRFLCRPSMVGSLGAILVFGGVIAWVMQPEQRLLRILPRLPESVVMVFRENARNPQYENPLSRELSRLLPMPQSRGVHVRPRAVLFTLQEKRLRAVAVYALRDLRGIVHDGKPWHGFLLLGDPVAVDQLRAVPLTHPVADIRRFLARPAASFRHALLVRQKFLAELLPFVHDADAGSWDLLRWTGDQSNVTFEFIRAGNSAWLAASGEHLPLSLPAPLLVLDGFPGSILAPENLPPVLEALRTASGLEKELGDLQRALRDVPVSIAVFDDGASFVPMVTARLQPGSEATITALVRDLLVKRLSVLFAEETTARGPRGERIRHLDPANGALLLRISENPRGTMLFAPCGAAYDQRTIAREECFAPTARTTATHAPDIVAFIGKGLLAISTRESLIEEIVNSAGAVSGRENTRDVFMAIDGAKLRQFPAVAAAIDAAPDAWRSWLIGLERLRLTASRDPQGISIRGAFSVRFR